MSASADPVLHGRVTRFVLSATAIKHAGLLDRTTADEVLRLSKAVKFFVEAHDYGLARLTLGLFAEVLEESKVAKDTDVAVAVTKHVAGIRQRITINAKGA